MVPVWKVPATCRLDCAAELPRYTVYVPDAISQLFEVVSQYDSGCEESFSSTSTVTLCCWPGVSETFCHPTRRLGGSFALAGSAR